ncbi:hypothetical protein PV08_02884 [Exophiala spinifera]|uniref:ferric-chelate reductase (NADPH) n=1 Tax=Exophiala spinifera TaxID=91928 RepID=A0A0D2BJ45_9EURO|nr:uncharacterized protein PV08_02884 [Exophiala spinifera]KIW18595.1 hypothetical protein PV08_02884 [Exophiala spinifera]
MAPWLDLPIMLHSSRDYMCMLNTTEQCAYQQGYWRFWYEADHRYGLPTVAFFLTAIILFYFGHFLSSTLPTGREDKITIWRRITASIRFLSYRGYRLGILGWNSPPLGLLLLGATGVVFFFCMTLGPKPYYWPNTRTLTYGNSPPIATRSGWMALACMPFVFATAAKANMITLLTGVSHEKLQVFHRWISYAMYILALIHTFPFIVFNIWKHDMVEQWNTSVFYWTGVVALLAQSWLVFGSISPLRKRWYEAFKVTHFIAGLTFVVFFFLHCDYTLTSWDYFIATGVLYVVCVLYSQLRTFARHGLGQRANISLATNGLIQVSVPVSFDWTPGQHCFIRFRSMGLHGVTIHPFTICSLPHSPINKPSNPSSTVDFYIRPSGGFTGRLAKHAGGGKSETVMLYGPYGGVNMQRLLECDRLVVIAGGSGAGWTLPFVELQIRHVKRILKAEASSDVAPSLKLIVATRDLTTCKWYLGKVQELLDAYGTTLAEIKSTVEMYFTGAEPLETDSSSPSPPPSTSQFVSKKVDEKDTEMVHPETASDSVDLDALGETHTGRPDLKSMISKEGSREWSQILGVFVCGPLEMQNDVRNAVADQQLDIIRGSVKDVYLHTEHFDWA